MLQVNEPAGTYLWHDHSSQLRADGLQGALIVHAHGGQAAEPWTYDAEQTLLLSDWFHGTGYMVHYLVHLCIGQSSQHALLNAQCCMNCCP